MRKFVKALPLLALLALAMPSSASAQATRTWVSGVGDDVNPCNRTAPCKTFPGAISKTAAGGTINCLDPGGFGALTINKSLKIRCDYTEGGMLTNVSNGITVNAGANDRIVLRGLDIEGLSSNFHGIRILQARSVKILDTEIANFGRNGVSLEPVAGATVKLVVDRSSFHDNRGVGVMVAPASGGTARAHVRRTSLDENGCGVAASKFGVDPAFNFAVNCGTNAANANSGIAVANVLNNDIADSDRHSVFSSGDTTTVRIGGNTVVGSLGAALQATSGGNLLTFGNNLVAGNPGGNGTPTGPVPGGVLKRKHRK
jgi:hypothetical protein